MALIEDPSALDELISRLQTEPLLAVDTEAASFHRYRDRVYLLQISSRAETAVVDPLAVGGLSAFAALLADPAIETVFHDADYDLRLLDREYGLRTTHLFDTRIAAQLLNEPGVGLAALLEKYLGVRLDKRFQRADWSARPLSQGMLDYAAADTRHLPELRDILRGQLEERGRLSWAEEEFELLAGTRFSPPNGDEPAYLRMKGAKALRGRELAVLRELHDWREGVAQKADKATFRVLNNDPILAMARTPPTDLEALKLIPGISADQAERRGREILAAVQRGLEVPEGNLPRIVRPPRRAHDPAFEARLERLKTVRNRLAIELELAPGVLCPNGTLEAVARGNPLTIEEMATTPELRRWQLSAIGEELLEALKGTSGATSEESPATSPSPAAT
ncbi:MAG: ribonuclease D [Gemmatimonadales bacterium]